MPTIVGRAANQETVVTRLDGDKGVVGIALDPPEIIGRVQRIPQRSVEGSVLESSLGDNRTRAGAAMPVLP